jgi:3',5'-nucleoside bisphosphate phosphatase
LNKDYRADLHVHTVLSPCAEIEMLPPLIVQEALDHGIQIIAITDHNASANITAVQQAARGTDLVVLPGMELQTREEIHVLCLFDTLEQVLELQKTVDRLLPPRANDPEHFGVQLVVDAAGDLVSQEERLLLSSVDISLNEAFHLVNRLSGLFIPAHINRKAYGLIEVLGFVPDDLPIEALEISRHLKPADVPLKFPQVRGYPLVQNGDVHRLDEFLGVNDFHISAPTINEMRLALQTRDGRNMIILA